MKLLWHEEFCNGPLTGLAIHNDEKVWIMMTEKDETIESDGSLPLNPGESYKKKKGKTHLIKPRIFAIYRLDSDTLKQIEDEHQKFRDHIGYQKEHDWSQLKPCSNIPADHIGFVKIIAVDKSKHKLLGYIPHTEISNYVISRQIQPKTEEKN